ncbi:MAG: radical SAM family heme chaperone HemW [Deferribacteraceae bacterium]|jgi:oxygen-independent coproporphyrinogen-3 oxidase|nr:radical SAM family heme chaperone HemW [Deferribacteraceae bacterium]
MRFKSYAPNQKKGLYIHIPFCASKCPYCSFYSVVGKNAYFDGYLAACLSEIAALPQKEFDTIYIGGGTPSHLGGERIGRFIYAFLKEISYDGTEFTVEVNPESADGDFIRALKDLPVTRVSIGVQSLNNKVLKLLGRIHSSGDALTLIDNIRKELNVEINADIIFDIPRVDYKEISDTLIQLATLSLEHISAYSYTPDTGYLATSVKDDEGEFLATEKLLEEKGYIHYEISNYAKPCSCSKHNLKYWREEEYIGIGAGAHSMVFEREGVRRYSRPPDIEHYIKNPIKRDVNELLDDATVLKEVLVFGLRLQKGVNLLEITERYGKLPQDILDKLEILEKKELLKCESGCISATKKGWLLLDSVTSYLW